jgi:hypothetical protein
MTTYLFHNVYGDADELIANKPDDVIAVPFGWTDAVEANRNQILANIGRNGVSTLPSVIYEVNEKMIDTAVFVYGNLEHSLAMCPQHYEEIRVFDMPKPWNWTDINNIIADTQLSTKPYPDFTKKYRWDVPTLSWIES